MGDLMGWVENGCNHEDFREINKEDEQDRVSDDNVVFFMKMNPVITRMMLSKRSETSIAKEK